MFIDLDAKFHVLKLLFEDFLPKIIRGAGNCESLILRAKFLCLKFGGTHGIVQSVGDKKGPCPTKGGVVVIFLDMLFK